MRCASLAVGIVNYEAADLRESGAELRYAVEDARAFNRYASLAWPSEAGSVHLALLDREASLASIIGAVEHIGAKGSFDIAILYLSGHGQRGLDGSGWFCASDAKTAEPSLNGQLLDSLLGLISAQSVLFLIDCCHAEAVTAGLAFFNHLQGRQARLFCASARVDERAWEEDKLRRSIFSHVLFLALSESSPLADRTGFVDVESVLLPYLRSQTPLLVAQQKRGVVQQPVQGGSAAAAISLPTVQMRSIGRTATLKEVLRAQARRILAIGVIAAVVALCIVETMFSHLAVSADQRILVRPGLSSTYSALPFHLASEIDTGYRITQLDRTKETEIQSLANGEFRSVNTHRSADGLQVWIEELEPLMKSRGTTEFVHVPSAVETGRSLAQEVHQMPVGFASINFAARIEGSQPAAYAKKTGLVENAPLIDLDCVSLSDNVVTKDFTISGSASIEDFIRGYLKYVAPQSPDPSAALWKLARFVSTRALLRAYDETAEAELDALLKEAIRNASEFKLSEDTRKAIEQTLAPKAATSCTLTATVLAAVLGSAKEQEDSEGELVGLTNEDSEAELLVRLRKNGVKFNTLFERLKRYLVMVASKRPLHTATLRRIAESVSGDIDPDLDGILEECPMDTTTYDAWLGQLLKSADDRQQIVAFRNLGLSYNFLTAAARDRVFAWAERKVNENAMVTDFVITLGIIGGNRPLSPSMTALLLSRLSPSARFSSDEPEDFDGSLIEVNADPAVAALSMAAPTSKLPEKGVTLVESIIARRPTLAFRAEAITGLGNRWDHVAGITASTIEARLWAQRRTSVDRLLTVQLAVEQLNAMAASRRATVLGDLARDWHLESEPEMRSDLGHILAATD